MSVAFDVADLHASTAFYSTHLGFEPVRSIREGQIYEERWLRSTRFPGIEIRLRGAFGKRPLGSCAGSMLYFSLRVANLSAAVDPLRGKVRWMGPDPATPLDATSASFVDPDGYLIRLES